MSNVSAQLLIVMQPLSQNLLAGFVAAASASSSTRGGVLASSVLASAVATQPVSLPRVRCGVEGGGLLSRSVRAGGSASALSCCSLLGSRVCGRRGSSGRSRANPAVERTCAKSRAGRSLLR